MLQTIRLGRRGRPSTIVLPWFQGSKPRFDSNWKEHDPDGVAHAALGRPEATGEAGNCVEAFETAKQGTTRWILLGLGKRQSFDLGTLRQATAQLGRHLARIQAGSVRIAIESALDRVGIDASRGGRAIGETLGLLTYDSEAWKGSASSRATRPTVTLHIDSRALADGVEFGLGLAESANVARVLSETPPNICTPSHIASEAKKMARKVGLRCRVVSAQKLEEEGLVGLHTVGRASENAPCLVRLEYVPEKPRRSARPAVLVGKTLTYDSGGLSIKTGGSMRGMKRDMDGGAGVFGAMHAIATVIRPKRGVIAYLCCAENAISEVAYRPDDIITYANGVTVEVTNTDAEGRLVLADGLIRACRDKPAYVIDMATLTGGVVVALGNTYAGMWCDDDELRPALEAASERSGERVWRLPLHAEYRDLMKSSVADIVNSAPVRSAHPIQGAAFLSYFVEKGVPWCHLDIAGVSTVDSDRGPFVRNSATGFGVRLLAELLDADTGRFIAGARSRG